ncbi:hypothetical protein EHS25_008148 [Saitozyma podzolica]|uniref:GRIP domain-containing protein n=1 Tax=Saitozyma podzolica TaxID=1890683 RepID=A0A427YNQ0_9TREE|nr:hypothetical protein EHS25_008148 [Saitozyma podzolica]
MSAEGTSNGASSSQDAGPSTTASTSRSPPTSPKAKGGSHSDSSSSAAAAAGPSSPPKQTLAAAAAILSPQLGSEGTPRSSMDLGERTRELENELAVVKQEKDVLGNQYRTLLGKLTAMRQSLGDKLREDAEELDRRENTINTLSTDNATLQSTIETLQTELASSSQEASNLNDQLAQLRSQSDSSSSDVLTKDSELRQATSELETQLKLAATSLSEFKLRAANAEARLSELSNDATRSTTLEKEMKEKNLLISKLRHDAVVNNEHLTEALRRLRKNTSDNNVDRRLVNNILISFLSTSRADSKRFEMLNLLSTILGWDDREREKAGLQRTDPKAGGKGKAQANKPGVARKDSQGREERSAEEEAAMNESFSNLFVEFLLKEASQGQPTRPDHESGRDSPLSPMRSPSFAGSMHYGPSPSLPASSPPATGASTPYASRSRTFSSSSIGSTGSPPKPALGLPVAGGRKGSYNLQSALQGDR